MVQPMSDQIEEQGFIALISVLILGAIGTSIITTLLLLGINSSKTDLALINSNQAKALANACAEEAITIVKLSPLSESSANLTIGEGSCTYSISTLGGLKSITSSGTVGAIVRKVSISLSSTSPTIVIASWQEIP
jgi:hypothetical protein